MSGFRIEKTLSACAAALLLVVGSTAAQAQSGPECDAYARDYATHHAPGGEVIGGAVGGAITGAIIGGIVGGGRGAGTGAAIGGGVGAFGGAANASNRWQAAYHHAYADCMARSHGSHAPTVYAEGPEPWTPEWYQYCSAKFRSFNPQTGHYVTYSGQSKLCR